MLGQVWRDPRGRQARLAALMPAVEIRPVDELLGRAAGVLTGRAQTSDPIHATVILVAEPGDCVLTGDPDDLEHLAVAAGKPVVIVAC